MIYLRIKFHPPRANGSLVIAIKTECDLGYRLHSSSALFFLTQKKKYYLKGVAYFFELSYHTSVRASTSQVRGSEIVGNITIHRVWLSFTSITLTPSFVIIGQLAQTLKGITFMHTHTQTYNIP
jgi:hypothetical protein